MSLNIQAAEFELVDVLGNTIAKSRDFSLNQINSYTGEISLDVTDFPSGVYFIKFKLGTSVSVTPMVVVH